MAAGKQILEQNPGAQTQLQTTLKKFQDVHNPAVRSASFHWLTSLSASEKSWQFSGASLCQQFLFHTSKFNQVKQPCSWSLNINYRLRNTAQAEPLWTRLWLVFFSHLAGVFHLYDTTFPWRHMKQLSWFWSLLQDFPLMGRENAEFTLTDSEQQQEATTKHFFHSEDG